MKLYTERQMREMFRMGLAHSINENGALGQFAPIELPIELTALNAHLKWLKKELQRVIDDGESESWVYAYKRAIKNAESLIEKYNNEQQ